MIRLAPYLCTRRFFVPTQLIFSIDEFVLSLVFLGHGFPTFLEGRGNPFSPVDLRIAAAVKILLR